MSEYSLAKVMDWLPLLKRQLPLIFSLESKITGRLKIRFCPLRFIWTGWLTPWPVINNVPSFELVMVTSFKPPWLKEGNFNWATWKLPSTIIMSDLITATAFDELGTPRLQLDSVDQRLSPLPLLKIVCWEKLTDIVKKKIEIKKNELFKNFTWLWR